MRRARISVTRRLVACTAIALAFSLVAVDVAAAVEAPPVTPASAAPVEVRHQVRKGESLSVIARRNGTTVSALAAANGITNVNRIVVGQWLVIPTVIPTAGGPATALVSPSPSVPVPVPAAPRRGSHTGHRGAQLRASARRQPLHRRPPVQRDGGCPRGDEPHRKSEPGSCGHAPGHPVWGSPCGCPVARADRLLPRPRRRPPRQSPRRRALPP